MEGTETTINVCQGLEESKAGQVYHVMLRGINRQDIFEKPEDYWTFIKILSMVQENLIRDVMIEIGSGPRQMSRVSGMSYNIIQYMWKNNEEQ